MQERVIGTETEFGLIFDDKKELQSDVLKPFIPNHLVMISTFLSNGARFYVDAYQRLEYATPECMGPAEAVHAEIAGESIAYETLSKMNAAGKVSPFHLHKRVVDDFGDSWGYHENYLMDREAYMTCVFKRQMLGHLATRNIFVGGGHWRPSKNDIARIVPGQKTQDIKSDVSLATTSNKPLLNTRDEAHADKEEYARLHITSGDANISPWATWLKLGSTSLVIRLAEYGASKVNGYEFSNPVVTARAIANDSELINTYELIDGRKITALDAQEMLIEECENMTLKYEIPQEEFAVLRAWREAHNDLSKDKNLLIGRSDWITRAAVLSGFVLRHEITFPDDKSLKHANQTWSMIHPQAGIGIRHFRPKMTFEGYSEDKSKHFQINPPDSTRAEQRGKLIKSVPRSKRKNASANWQNVSFGSSIYRFKNPLTKHPEISPL